MSAFENGAVFLSYASQDAVPAGRICAALRNAGVEVWFDQDALVGGDAWDAKIRQQIRDCALFVPVISTETQARKEGYFRLEWKLAEDRSHLVAKGMPFIVPVVIDRTTERGALVPDAFVSVQWTRLPGGETSPAFVARVQKLLEGAHATVPPPPLSRDEDIFAAALALPLTERAAFLNQGCKDDDALRVRVDALLVAHAKAQRILPNPLVSRVAVAAEEQPGEVIGRYKLLQKIGEGGCGVVWMAEQETPVPRRVALKVIKLGMDTKEVIGRFEAERQALAMMDHPNIAKVFDAGATDTGRPFFVMELVRGVPITRYCDEQNLPTAARLELFAQVCHAVQHAHQKGVIHRDLKPSNILVTVNDGRPVPKVIDFGIAKATQGRLTDSTVFTAFEQFIGTPAYMSPEQAVMTSLDIDTRSDIYSLGVLLYELLTGRTPFDSKALVAAGLDEIRRLIREVDPPRPSTRLSTLTDADQSAIAKHRATAPANLSLLLRGDLDWIIMRCLEKDRTRRYDTPSALAADINRHLTHEPVVARPPSAAYRMGKTVRRHKLLVSAAAAVVAALVVGLGISAWQWFEKTQAYHRATAAEREQTALRERAEAAGLREAGERKRAEENAAKATQQESYARRLLYAADMNLAQQALAANDVGRARALLERNQPKPGEPDLRGWEWRYLWQQSRNGALATLTHHTDRVNSLSFSPDSRLLAIGYWDGRIEVWDVPARTLRTTLRTSGNDGAAVFSPRDNVIAFTAGGGRVVVHDLGTATNKFILTPHGGDAVRLAISSDGGQLAVISEHGAQVFSMADGQRALYRIQGFFGWPHFGAAHFSPEGASLFANRVKNLGPMIDLSVAVLDARTGATRREFSIGRDQGQTALELPPDGRWVATASGFADEAVRIWNPETGAKVATLSGHTAWVAGLACSPDGKTLASAAADQTVRLWDTTSWSETAVLRGHGDEVNAVAYSPDGRLLASGDKNGEVLLWGTDRTVAAQPRFAFPAEVCNAWIPKGANHVITLSRAGRASRWELPALTESPVNLPPGPVEFFWPPHYFGMRAPNHSLRVYEALPTDTRLVGEAELGERASRIDFYADGTLSWNDGSGRNQKKVLRAPSATPPPNASALTVHNERGRVVFRQRAEPRAVVTVDEPSGAIDDLVVSPSGKYAVATTDYGIVALYEATTGRLIRRFRAHMKAARTAVFSSDERRLFTVGTTRELVKVWDLETGQELLTLAGEGASLYSAARSADDNALLVGQTNGTWQLWQAPALAEIDEAARLAREVAARVQTKPAVAPVRDPDRGIYVVSRDPVSGAFSGTATPLTPQFPESNSGPAWSPDGKQIAFKRRRADDAKHAEPFFDIVVQTASSTAERIYPAGESEPGPWTAPAWFPDGRSLIGRNFIDSKVRSSNRIDLADGSIKPLTAPGQKPALCVSHDGRTIFSVGYDPKEKTTNLHAIDAATGVPTKIWTSPFPFHEIFVPLRLALSPDGRTLAFVLNGPTTDSHLVRINTDGTDYRALVTVPAGRDRLSRSGLCWIENGRALLYLMPGDADQRLMRVAAEGGVPRFMGLTFREADVIFDLSPDGTRLAASPGLPLPVDPDPINNDVMWDWVLDQERANNLAAVEPVARDLLARYQQQTGTSLGHAGTRTILGRILVRREKFAEAEEVLRPAYQARNEKAPNEWVTHITRSVLGAALLGGGKLAEAEPLLLEAYRGLTTEIDLSTEDEPRPVETAEWLATLDEKRGLTEPAAQWRQRGRAANSAVRAHRLARDREYPRAVAGFEEATRLDPTLAPAWNMIAWLRATTPDPAVREGRAAVVAGLKACELSGWKKSEYIDSLAAAYAESGDFERAIELEQRALQSGQLNDRDHADYAARLALYQQHRPYRLSVRGG